MSAQRKRASAPHPRKPPRRPRVPAHRSYTPELLANGRRRYEQTDESVSAIAADFGIHHYSLIRLAQREGWVRHERPQRALPRAARLLAQAEALEAQAPQELAPGGAQARPGWGAEEIAAPLSGTIERLYRAVLDELATVEAMHARRGTLPERPVDAVRTAQTLSSLTETLQKLQRLRCAVPFSGSDDDDMPADIDEFRNELARQIEAFMESRPDEDDAGGDTAAPVAAVR
jgi:transposase-like protein